MDNISDYMPKAYFTMLVFGCVIFVVYLVMLFVLWK